MKPKTQVLLFTHHRRVLELAGTLQAEVGVFMHELDSPGPMGTPN